MKSVVEEGGGSDCEVSSVAIVHISDLICGNSPTDVRAWSRSAKQMEPPRKSKSRVA